jgi:predicted nucleic acid-binding protein
MYLIDTDVISEIRKKSKAHKGVRQFFKNVIESNIPVYLSVVSIGELRRGIEKIRNRGDTRQANLLEKWFEVVLVDYQEQILSFDIEAAQLWGALRVPHYENALGKQIAATALLYDLTVVTGNIKHYKSTGAKLHNPFI